MESVLEAINNLSQSMSRRFDALDAKFDTRCDQIEAKFDTRCDQIEAKFDQRCDQLDRRCNELDDKLAILGEGFDLMNMKIDHISHQGQSFKARLEAVELKTR